VSSAPEVDSLATEEFQNEDGSTFSTNIPLVKSALVLLAETWPRLYSFEELCESALSRAGAAGQALPGEKARALLAQSLAKLYLSNFVGLHVHVPPFVLSLSDRPLATPLVRLQARTGAPICNRRHRQAVLPVLDRAVLARLDGTRDRPALVEDLTAAVLRGELGLQAEGKPLEDPQTIRATLAAELEASLVRLAQSMLLVG
jgi:methyltransferase-like protein